jgi:hypothetical protein
MLLTLTASLMAVSLHSPVAIEDYITSRAMAYEVPIEKALAISYCESGMRQFNKDGSVLKGRVNNKDIGFFQINEFYHLDTSLSLGMDIYNPYGNIEYAMWLLKNGGDKHWDASRGCWKPRLLNTG